MNAYRLAADLNRYQNLVPTLESQWDTLIVPMPPQKDWLPFEVGVYRDHRMNRRLPPADFTMLGGTIPVFTQNAREVLSTLVACSGEWLRIFSIQRDYFVLNVTCTLNALDLERSKSTRFESSGRIMEITHHAFYERVIQDAVIFRIPQVIASIFVTERFVRAVSEAGLTGFLFLDQAEVVGP